MTEDIQTVAAGLLGHLGIHGACRVIPLRGGANNRVFRVESEGGAYALKAYFYDGDDRRDRLQAELLFLTFVWEQGIRCIPRPLAADSRQHAALYEFVEGTTLTPPKVDAARVDEAVQFVRAANSSRRSPSAFALPLAAEACFSLAQHVECLDRRLLRLMEMPVQDDVDAEAQAFVRTELSPAAQHARSTWLSAEDALLPAEDRCLSPSDFGFHNALLRSDGRVCFLDFEYAGWDDPAKLVCDFFCQVAVPVGHRHLAPFAEAVAGMMRHPEAVLRRIKCLLPLYQLKWCCIVLNDFLPLGASRREWSLGPEVNGRKVGQLRKAQAMFQSSRELSGVA